MSNGLFESLGLRLYMSDPKFQIETHVYGPDSHFEISLVYIPPKLKKL
jgi:hypothetical protein